MKIAFTTQIWQEGKMFVSYTPELDVSSCGYTPAEAKKNLQEAVAGFVEAASAQGTLDEILEESGFTRGRGEEWEPRRVLATDLVQLAL